MITPILCGLFFCALNLTLFQPCRIFLLMSPHSLAAPSKQSSATMAVSSITPPLAHSSPSKGYFCGCLIPTLLRRMVKQNACCIIGSWARDHLLREAWPGPLGVLRGGTCMRLGFSLARRLWWSDRPRLRSLLGLGFPVGCTSIYMYIHQAIQVFNFRRHTSL
jgi:hypothetical protein